jgi:hypothetical protein
MITFEAELYWLQNPKPVKFYPYTTIVTNYLFWEDKQKVLQPVYDLFMEVRSKAIELGAKWDNKVAVECTIEGFPHPVFFGYIDHAIVLGFSVECEKWC